MSHHKSFKGLSDLTLDIDREVALLKDLVHGFYEMERYRTKGSWFSATPWATEVKQLEGEQSKRQEELKGLHQRRVALDEQIVALKNELQQKQASKSASTSKRGVQPRPKKEPAPEPESDSDSEFDPNDDWYDKDFQESREQRNKEFLKVVEEDEREEAKNKGGSSEASRKRAAERDKKEADRLREEQKELERLREKRQREKEEHRKKRDKEAAAAKKRQEEEQRKQHEEEEAKKRNIGCDSPIWTLISTPVKSGLKDLPGKIDKSIFELVKKSNVDSLVALLTCVDEHIASEWTYACTLHWTFDNTRVEQELPEYANNMRKRLAELSAQAKKLKDKTFETVTRKSGFYVLTEWIVVTLSVFWYILSRISTSETPESVDLGTEDEKESWIEFAAGKERAYNRGNLKNVPGASETSEKRKPANLWRQAIP